MTVNNAAGSTNVGTWRVHAFYPGMVSAWGADDEGQLERPADLTNTLAIAAGEYHSLAVKENGTVVQWGFNWADVPTNLNNVIAVSAGFEHSLALRDNGTVVAWGDEEGSANFVPTNLVGVTAIAAGWNNNLELLTNGTVSAWGVNGADLDWRLLEVPGDLTNATAISAGALHSLALRSNGTVTAWFGTNERVGHCEQSGDDSGG